MRSSSPCGPGVGISAPLRNIPSTGSPCCQSRAGHLAPVGAEPPDVGQPRALELGAAQEARRGGSTGCARRSRISRRVNSRIAPACGVLAPVEPGDLVVLAPGVVVAALRAADLVAAEQHRRALGEEQRGQEVALLARAQREDLRGRRSRPRRRSSRSGCRRCRRGCPRGWPRCACRCRRRGRQREAVVGGDEVDRGERVAAVGLVEVGGAGEARGEVADAGVPAPEVAHRVAVDAVPLRPQHREVADLVAARPDVPRLGDQLDLREHRVLVDHVEERRQPVDVVELARQRRGEVEAEAVDVALDRPSSAASP